MQSSVQILKGSLHFFEAVLRLSALFHVSHVLVQRPCARHNRNSTQHDIYAGLGVCELEDVLATNDRGPLFLDLDLRRAVAVPLVQQEHVELLPQLLEHVRRVDVCLLVEANELLYFGLWDCGPEPLIASEKEESLRVGWHVTALEVVVSSKLVRPRTLR
eukprot:TRINITY_DN751_c0_g1_i3.p2 TRINITY_DN751_c0_g1~~TRINITY_DN751_c0_g1_i3.p2  ORF type:complete len:160 (-),score=19.68 TRINITY_DN751_c0_g1_i3:13-492(-)